MSWTDADTVKKHLFDLDRRPTDYHDVAVDISATGSGSLPHRGLVEESEKVKRIAVFEPAGQSGVQLNGETWVQLSYDNLVPGQLVVADDDGLQVVYTEGIDYAVNWSDGKIRRIDGGNLSDGAFFDLFCLRYEILQRDTDYTINWTTGEITTTTSGKMKPDTTVRVDYSLNAASGADQLIPEAITEAEDKIATLLKEGYSSESSDQGLKTGATELSLSVVCRGLASRALSDGVPAAEGRAKAWLSLARELGVNAWATLRPFLESPLSHPGDKKRNRSWDWE